MITQTLLIDNLIVSYQSFIWRRDRFLLFLHGRGRSKKDWESYFSTLEKNQISFLVLDFPGFWGSQIPKDIRGVKEYSEFVLRFLEKLHVTEPIEIVAHSFGGRIAFYLAAKYPEKVSKLWLMAPGGVERLVSKTKKLMLKLGKNILPQRMQQYLKNRISSVDYQNAGKLLPIFQKVVSEDIRELFPQISQLVYLYWWAQDDQIEQWQIDVMREKLSNLIFKAFPDVGHDVHQEKATEVLSNLLSN